MAGLTVAVVVGNFNLDLDGEVGTVRPSSGLDAPGRRISDAPASSTLPDRLVAARPPGGPRSVPDLPLIVALARISLAVALREEAALTADGRRPAGAVSSLHDRTGTTEDHP